MPYHHGVFAHHASGGELRFGALKKKLSSPTVEAPGNKGREGKIGLPMGGTCTFSLIFWKVRRYTYLIATINVREVVGGIYNPHT